MATIANAKNVITLGLPAGQAKVVVTCDVRFTNLEMFLMKQGLRFRFDCKVWGEDSFIGADGLAADDFLFAYTSQFYPDVNPAALEKVTFERTVPANLLNEDIGTDEVYGELILTNLEDNSKKRAKSNVVKHQFG